MGNQVFIAMCKSFNIPEPVEEFKFCEDRKFRADFCWPKQKIILEVEGGIWSGGMHGRGVGITRDIEKYNLAATLGYKVLRVVPREQYKLATFEMIKKCL